MRSTVLFFVLLFAFFGENAQAAALEVVEERTVVDDVLEFRWFVMKIVGVATPLIGLSLWYALRLQDKANLKAIKGYQAQSRQTRMLNGGPSSGQAYSPPLKSSSAGDAQPGSPVPSGRKPKLFGKGKVPAH